MTHVMIRSRKIEKKINRLGRVAKLDSFHSFIRHPSTFLRHPLPHFTPHTQLRSFLRIFSLHRRPVHVMIIINEVRDYC